MKKPWQCPKHPDALIKHSWDETYVVFRDGYPRGSGMKNNHSYQCGECGLELANNKRAKDER